MKMNFIRDKRRPRFGTDSLKTNPIVSRRADALLCDLAFLLAVEVEAAQAPLA